MCIGAQNKFKVLWYNFPSDGHKDFPPGVYLYRASNDFVHQIKVG